MPLHLEDQMTDPGLQLRTFLRERRSRVSPQSAGLPVHAPRRTEGLRREDVAELLDVTPLWYALFESGTSGRKFSNDFLQRVGTVLRLDEDDRETMLQFVVASGHATRDLETEWYGTQWSALMVSVADASRRLVNASSREEAVLLAMSALRTGFAPSRTSCTFFEPRGIELVAIRYDGLPVSSDVIGTCVPRDSVGVLPEPCAGAKLRQAMMIPIFVDHLLSGAIRVEAARACEFAVLEIAAARVLADHLGYALTA